MRCIHSIRQRGGIDDDTASSLTSAEAVNAVVGVGQDHVTGWAPEAEAADYDACHANWNGGKHYSATFRGYGVAAELFHRSEEEGEDDLQFGEWEWMPRRDTPQILIDGMETLVACIAAAMVAERDSLVAESARREAAFAAEQNEDD